MIENLIRFFLVVLLFPLPCLVSAEEPMPTTTDPACGAMEFKAGEIIVEFKESFSQTSVQSLLLTEDVSIVDKMDNLGLMLLSVPKGRELEKVEELKRNPLVKYAEPKARTAAALREKNWDALREEEREQLIDDILHEGD